MAENSEIAKFGTVIVCPRGIKGGGLLNLEMSKVEDAEARLSDVARVNVENAPPLLALYNEAYLELRRMLSTLKLEHSYAIRISNQRRALVILDVAPKVLQEKGLSTSKNPAGSADLREAVLDADPEYQSTMDRVDMIAAIHSLLEGKAKSIEMAYTAVKRIIDRGNGQSLGSISTSMPVSTDPLPTELQRYREGTIGRAKY